MTKQIACLRCNDGSTPLYCINCAEELLKIEQLRNVRVLREALRKIVDIAQLTNVTFEVQAFTAVDIATTALKEDGR